MVVFFSLLKNGPLIVKTKVSRLIPWKLFDPVGPSETLGGMGETRVTTRPADMLNAARPTQGQR